MIISDSVRIGGMEYAVRYIDGLNDGANVLYGRVDWAAGLIDLQSGMSHGHACITLWHELIHALLHHECVELDEKTEERRRWASACSRSSATTQTDFLKIPRMNKCTEK